MLRAKNVEEPRTKIGTGRRRKAGSRDYTKETSADADGDAEDHGG